MLILRKILAVLILMIATLALSVPAAASNTHRISHVGTVVALDAHHDHASTNDVRPDANQSDGKQGKDVKHSAIGHNHVGEFATTDPSLVLADLTSRNLPKGYAAVILSSLVLPPQDRPPRTA